MRVFAQSRLQSLQPLQKMRGVEIMQDVPRHAREIGVQRGHGRTCAV